MAGLGDIGAKILGVAQRIAIIDDKFKRQEEDIRDLRVELSKLRDAINGLNMRVAMLEEGRKTTEADVKRVMTEVVANWERQHSERERRRLEEEISQLRRGLNAKNE